eukprot:3260486-Amphidinium_carterae.1
MKKLWLASEWDKAKMYIKKTEKMSETMSKRKTGVLLSRGELVKKLGKRAATGYIKKIEKKGKNDPSLLGECFITGEPLYMSFTME